MAYSLRQFDPKAIYFLTAHTLQSRLLLTPSKKTNELLGGILARASRQCGIELFAYVFGSNHFHLMVRAPSGIAMSKFMQRLQANIAIKVGRLVDWRGRFFARRYFAEPVIDDEVQVERLNDILSHGVKEGLVSAVKDWPGLSCAEALLKGGAPSPQTWRDWTRRSKMEAGDALNIDRFGEECPSESEALTLTPLPCWSRYSAAARVRLTARLIEKIDATGRGRREVMGPARIRAQDPHGRPEETQHAPRLNALPRPKARRHISDDFFQSPSSSRATHDFSSR